MGSGFESQGAHIEKDPADSSESAGFLRSLINTVLSCEVHIILFASGFDAWKTVFALVPTGVGRVGTSRLPRLRGALHVSSAPTQGHPSPGRSAPPCFAVESVRADTLRALPENVAAPQGFPGVCACAKPGGCVEVSVASVATSGCPKRSEGGFPCRSEEGAEPRADPAVGGSWFGCAPLCLANWGGVGCRVLACCLVVGCLPRIRV